MQGYNPVPQQPYPQQPYPQQPYQQPYQQPSYAQPGAPGGYAQPPSTGGYVPPQPAAVGGYNATPLQGQGYANQPVPQAAAVPSPIFGIQFVYVLDPMSELAMSTGVLIRQQAQFLEQITGCESPNRYYVFSQSPQGGMKLLFKCKEYSSCCMRNCCTANSREFNMIIKHVANSAGLDENFSTPFVDIKKPFKLTCFCLDRPEMIINYGSNGQRLGRIKQPFSCCDPIFYTFNSSGTHRYIIHADCCQCGLICANNFCGKLSEVLFNIYKPDNLNIPCGTIRKKSATGSELVTSADSYQVNFPNDASPEDKMVLIAAGLMIDYQFFEESASNDNTSQAKFHRGY